MNSTLTGLDSTSASPTLVRAAGDRQIVGLDLIRFAAACSVMLYHLAFVIWAGHHVAVSYHYLGPYAWPGWIGVEVFFLLSGFIISFSAQGATAGSFAKGRFIRLYPTAWICSTLTMIALLFARQEKLGLGLLHVWANTNLLFTSGPYLDGSYWTLQVELSFYLLVFLLLLVGRFRYLVPVIACVGLMSTAYITAYAAAHHGVLHLRNPGRLFSFIDSPLSHIFLVTYGCFFAAGSLLWACLLQRASTVRVFTLLICIAGCLLEVRTRAKIAQDFFHVDYSWVPPFLIWIAALLAITLAVRLNQQISSVFGSKGMRIARYLGLMTYPLYLIHQVAGTLMIASLRSMVPDLAALLITMSFLVLLSFAVHSYLERPVQHSLRNLLPGGKRSHARPEIASLT